MSPKKTSPPDVTDILKTIKTRQKDDANVAAAEKQDEIETDEDIIEESPRGRPKSGRIWKTQKERFNTVKKSTKRVKPLAKHLILRNELKHVKELSRSIKDEKRKENEEYRLRREANLKRRQENERKNEIVQVIKNTAKIKRMSKKQLRKVEKRDTTSKAKVAE